VYIVAGEGTSVPSQGRVIDHVGWRWIGTMSEAKAMVEGKHVQLPSQPSPLDLPNGPPINFFYVAGLDGISHRTGGAARTEARRINANRAL
jgi:hypothetical protein